jgi:hypothetical protein
MAQIPTCPPTITQCSHSILAAPSAPLANIMGLNVGSSFMTPSFTFTDHLSTQCASIPVPGPGCDKSYSLVCLDCGSCSTISSCSGTCASLTNPVFQNSFTPSGDTASITVAPILPSDAGTYSCKVRGTMGSQTLSSNAFYIEICPSSCSDTKLVNTLGFLPNFPGLIAIGPTGASSTFVAPEN